MYETSRKLDETLSYASFGRRLSAWALDFILMGVVSISLSLVTGLIGAGFIPKFVYSVGAAVLAIAYYCGFESSKFQATPGKMALGLQVTDIDGKRVSFLRALARHWAMCISNITCGIGYLMILWTRKHQGLHDKVANCLVVRKPKILGCGHEHAPARDQ